LLSGMLSMPSGKPDDEDEDNDDELPGGRFR
jgi:hypothetical protein